MIEIKQNDNVDEILDKEFVIIVAKSRSCSVCEPVAMQLEAVLKDYKDIEIYSIYIDEHAEFRGQHLIFTVPTIIVFSDGKEILRESRFIDFNKILRLVEVFNN